jgi:hypothetical protein
MIVVESFKLIIPNFFVKRKFIPVFAIKRFSCKSIIFLLKTELSIENRKTKKKILVVLTFGLCTN